MSIESIVNQALDLVGYKRHIGSIWDGTPAARVALNAYAEVRDEVLAAQPWVFARNFYGLAPDAGGAALPWSYSYLRPPSAIVVLDVFSGPLLVPARLDPQPTRWLEMVSGDRIILTEFSPAAAMVTDRVTDTSLWSPDFTLVVIRTLAQRFQRLLPGVPAKEENQ